MKKAVLIITTIVLAFNSFSQNNISPKQGENSTALQVHVGVAFPSEDLAKETEFGFNAGIKYYSPLSVEHLSFVMGLDVYRNGADSDLQSTLNIDLSRYSVSMSDYYNVPLMGGINYALLLNGNTKLFVEFTLGVDYFKLTNTKISYRSDLSNSTFIGFDPSIALCQAFEIGLVVNKNLVFSFKNSYLGAHKIKANMNGMKLESSSGNVGELTLALGVLF